MDQQHPRISIVTACYNASAHIEATLSSVLSQNYPNLEYIIIDGGSSDGTVEIIKRFSDRITYFVSEPDGGQYEGIQKGLARATGEILCWLNADDIYMPWTLSVVGEIFAAMPDVNWLTGQPAFLNRRDQMTMNYSGLAAYPQRMIAKGLFNRELGGFLQQESMFWRRSLFETSGGSLDLSLSYAADYELWTRFAKHSELNAAAVPLAAFRKLPGEQRSSVGATIYDAEVAAVMARLGRPPLIWQAVFGRGGVVMRSIARLMISARAPAILYDDGSDQWQRIKTRRSISRLGLRDLCQQFLLRRARK